MSTTPYMNLDLPTPSVTEGPEWAESVNTAVETIDSHDHSPGKGVPVPTSGLNINADLDFNSNSATSVKSVQLEPQSSLATASSLYEIGDDLWFNNGGGTPVQITQGTSIASASSPLVPAGVIWPYGGSSAPTGFLLCDGTAVSRTTYSTLFAAIGTTYGTGDGSTTFNIPNANGRTAVGAGTYTDTVSGSVTRTLGSSGGAEKHVVTVSEMPSHNHGGGAHTHATVTSGVSSTNLTTTSQGLAAARSLGNAGDYTAAAGGTPDIGTTSSSGTIITSQGSGTAHNNMQPYFVTNYIIKT